jgi:hypothetical protein
MSESRRITKIKAKKNASGAKHPVEILVDYQIPDSTAADGYLKAELISHDEPREELWLAMADFLPLYITVVGLDSDIWTDGELIAVSIKHLDTEDDEGNDVGITLTGKCDVNGIVACPTSPFVRLQSEAIAKLTSEALNYIDGIRSFKAIQMSLL